MTSREALEYLFGLALFNADKEQHKKCREANKIIYEDLKDYEELKKLMETSIQEIMKKSKVLEILKRTKIDLWDFKRDTEYVDYEYYSKHYRKYSLEMLSREEFNMLKEWLENDK